MRIVIKIGTNLLTGNSGELHEERITALVKDIALVRKNGIEVVIVTSGAIGTGMGRMKISARPSALREKQALAAIGQPILMGAWQKNFNSHKLTVAQVLLTRQDFEDRHSYLNVRNTLYSLIDFGVIPVINENDTVAVEEINFGDNDTLSALVSATVDADLLYILTDVDGLYKGVPGKSDIISVIDKITCEIEECASGTSSSGKGVGGMKTKIDAAKIATSYGVTTVIANGTEPGILRKLLSGDQVGTTFKAKKSIDARKHWIAFGMKPRGKIFVDEGAESALLKGGKSLLPSGITGSEGTFAAGDTVCVLVKNKKEIARGLSNYSNLEIEKIKGKRSKEIKEITNSADIEEVIHRDNLVIFDN